MTTELLIDEHQHIVFSGPVLDSDNGGRSENGKEGTQSSESVQIPQQEFIEPESFWDPETWGSPFYEEPELTAEPAPQTGRDSTSFDTRPNLDRNGNYKAPYKR